MLTQFDIVTCEYNIFFNLFQLTLMWPTQGLNRPEKNIKIFQSHFWLWKIEKPIFLGLVAWKLR